jgi:hypothetical protein
VARERGPERVPRGGRRGLVCCRRRHCRESEEKKGFGLGVLQFRRRFPLFGDAAGGL